MIRLNREQQWKMAKLNSQMERVSNANILIPCRYDAQHSIIIISRTFIHARTIKLYLRDFVLRIPNIVPTPLRESNFPLCIWYVCHSHHFSSIIDHIEWLPIQCHKMNMDIERTAARNGEFCETKKQEHNLINTFNRVCCVILCVSPVTWRKFAFHHRMANGRERKQEKKHSIFMKQKHM